MTSREKGCSSFKRWCVRTSVRNDSLVWLDAGHVDAMLLLSNQNAPPRRTAALGRSGTLLALRVRVYSRARETNITEKTLTHLLKKTAQEYAHVPMRIQHPLVLHQSNTG